MQSMNDGYSTPNSVLNFLGQTFKSPDFGHSLTLHIKKRTKTMWQLSATEVVNKLKTGEVSPLEIVDVAIERIQKVEPHINALPIQFFEEARDIAKKFKRPKNPSLGWLGGLPIAIMHWTVIRIDG